jgi:hypothetical protein
MRAIIAIAGWKRAQHRRHRPAAATADGIAVDFADYRITTRKRRPRCLEWRRQV